MTNKNCKNCGCQLNKEGTGHYEEAEDEQGVFCDNFKFIGFVNNTPVPHYKQCCCEKPEALNSPHSGFARKPSSARKVRKLHVKY